LSIKIPTYYKSENQFKNLHQDIWLYDCPYCQESGCLILHSVLYGNDPNNYTRRVRRGQRVFCSNRRKRGRNGCGKTFCLLLAVFIKSFTLTTHSLWAFLSKLKDGVNRLRAFCHSDMAPSSVYRIYERFRRQQSRIRTLLSGTGKPPPLLENVHDPLIATIIHLQSVFKTDPITCFQLHFQSTVF
jgi:hypothetical protein